MKLAYVSILSGKLLVFQGAIFGRATPDRLIMTRFIGFVIEKMVARAESQPQPRHLANSQYGVTSANALVGLGSRPRNWKSNRKRSVTPTSGPRIPI